MKTKKLFEPFKVITWAFAVMILVTTFYSCEQFDLEENEGATQLVVVPYTSLREAQLGVTGIYGQLRQTAWMTTFFVNGWSGDDITTHRESNKADFREYDQRFITQQNSRTADNWSAVYRMVRSANTVLVNSEGLVLGDPIEQASLQRILGETYFLRGIMFHHLARIHGRIALPLTIDLDFEIGLASQEEVYAQIESDLLQAESLLPGIYPGVESGAPRPNAGSARAMLARLYLDWAGFPLNDNSRYALAASSARTVIDNAGTHGFALVDDMASLYTIEGRFNTESLFTIAYSAPNQLANRKNGRLGLPGDFNGWQETFAEIRFFEDFPESARKDATYHTEVPVNAAGNITSDVANAADFVTWTAFRDQQNPVFRKIVGPFEESQFGEFQTSRNDYFMRYSELLLIFAEASGRSGSVPAEAWEALNMVRRRSMGLPVGTPDASIDAGPADGAIEELAYTERKWELAGEYLRWNDLVRMERVEEALGGTARDPQVSIGTIFDGNGVGNPTALTSPTNGILGSLGTDNYFAPVPQIEIDQLPNLGN